MAQDNVTDRDRKTTAVWVPHDLVNKLKVIATHTGVTMGEAFVSLCGPVILREHKKAVREQAAAYDVGGES